MPGNDEGRRPRAGGCHRPSETQMPARQRVDANVLTYVDRHGNRHSAAIFDHWSPAVIKALGVRLVTAREKELGAKDPADSRGGANGADHLNGAGYRTGEAHAPSEAAAPGAGAAEEEPRSSSAARAEPAEPAGVPEGRRRRDELAEAVAVVRNADGTLVLSDAERADWLLRFGGDGKALELALMKAAGWIQHRGSHSLLQQVRRQLAHTAFEKRERDKRYQASKASSEMKKFGHVLRSSPYHDNEGGPKAFEEYTARMIREGKFDPKSKH
jgi:hypothetical protein